MPSHVWVKTLSISFGSARWTMFEVKLKKQETNLVFLCNILFRSKTVTI